MPATAGMKALAETPTTPGIRTEGTEGTEGTQAAAGMLATAGTQTTAMTQTTTVMPTAAEMPNSTDVNTSRVFPEICDKLVRTAKIYKM